MSLSVPAPDPLHIEPPLLLQSLSHVDAAPLPFDYAKTGSALLVRSFCHLDAATSTMDLANLGSLTSAQSSVRSEASVPVPDFAQPASPLLLRSFA